MQNQQVKVEEIMDQKDLVDTRDEDIREIATMAEKVFAISNDIKNLTKKQGQGLDNIIKKQDNIEDNAEKAVEELAEANEFSRKKLKKVLIWGGVVLALAVCVTALVYIIKGTKKKPDDPTVKIQVNEFGDDLGYKMGALKGLDEELKMSDYYHDLFKSKKDSKKAEAQTVRFKIDEHI